MFSVREGVARRVRVDGGQRSVVTRVHGLQHVERFLAADLAHHNAIGPHAQRVARMARRTSFLPSILA
jgi:hypothetical protein